jgi:hypothetical protein
VQLTSPSRRVFGVLAAGTIGLSTALLGITGVAHADPADTAEAPVAAADTQLLAANVPNAPAIDSVYGDDTKLDVFFETNDPADGDVTTDWADNWEYNLDGGSWTPVTPDFTSGFGEFEITGLTNDQDYVVRVRGVSDISGPGTASAPMTGTPYKSIGAPGTPAVTLGAGSVTVSWTAPTTTGTYDLAGYEVYGYVDTGSDAQSGGQVDLCETGPTVLTCTAKATPGYKYVIFVSAVDAEDNYGWESDPSEQTAAVPAAAVPATVPAKNGDLTLPAGASSTVAPGTTITVSGSGYAPGSTVSVAIYSTPQVLTTVVADASGNFTVTVTVPAGLAAGEHTLVASGVDNAGNPRYVNLPVTVSASGTATIAAATLAYTGADVLAPALGGLAAVAVGTGLIVVRRRAARSAA